MQKTFKRCVIINNNFSDSINNNDTKKVASSIATSDQDQIYENIKKRFELFHVQKRNFLFTTVKCFVIRLLKDIIKTYSQFFFVGWFCDCIIGWVVFQDFLKCVDAWGPKVEIGPPWLRFEKNWIKIQSFKRSISALKPGISSSFPHKISESHNCLIVQIY
jgi:hypothetical protein